MIEDDLDRLLTDIDDINEYSSSREGTREYQQKQVRKHDSAQPSGEDSGDLKESFLKRVEKLDFGNASRFHNKGIVETIKFHLDQCTRFKDKLNYFDAPDGLQPVLRKYNYNFVRFLENIERQYDKYVIELNRETLRKQALKDFPLVFEGYQDEKRVDFLLLKELFVRLRNFNSIVKKEWAELEKSIGVINFADGGKPLFQQLDNIVSESLKFCKQTDTFLHAVAVILSIPAEDFDVLERDLNNRLVYHDFFDYSLDNVFSLAPEVTQNMNKKGEMEEYRRERSENMDELGAERDTGTDTTETEATIEEESSEESTGSGFDQPGEAEYSRTPTVEFTVKGSRHWNTREPYVIHVDYYKLSSDYAELRDAFYFTSGPMSEDAIKGEIRRSLVKFKSGGDADIIPTYEEFLYRKISSLYNDIMDEFSVSGDNQALFFYHLGPATIYNILIAEFKNNNYGSCYKYEEGNRIRRFLPAEFIKENALRWFENNINSLDIPFDSINNFDSIRKKVSRKYYAEIDQFNRRVDEVISRMDLETRKKIDRKQFVKQKAPLKFSPMQIIIYNRFVEKTAFK